MRAEPVEPEGCDVCGRHMLYGERTREYLSPEHERRAVCDLCRTRVERAGWVRADRGIAVPRRPEQRPRGRPGVAANVQQRRGRRRAPADGERARSTERAMTGSRGGGETPERRIRRALDRFNRSEHRRTVEGLTRSLGRPRVAAVTPAEAPDQVRLTVAWDLSWYQWKVDFSDDHDAVREFRNGKEVSELGPADRAWNARAGEDGRLQLRLGTNGDGEAVGPDEPA